jgi:hypothetical protein
VQRREHIGGKDIKTRAGPSSWSSISARP